jgi:predicted nucleic acid-binding protein
MKLLDSNILIYAPQPTFAHLLPLLVDPTCLVSEIARLEVLGFHRLTALEKTYYERFFLQKTVLPITSDIIDLAIEYRQTRKMSVGDSIHAATAFIHQLEFQTRNISDFSHISGLLLNNPV